MQLLDGKFLAQKTYQEITNKLDQIPTHPKLAVILIGEDPSSIKYVELKEKAALSLNLPFQKFILPSDVSTSEVEALIDKLNASDVTGFFLQLPLPSHLPAYNLLNRISASKDVDGLTTVTLGHLCQGEPSIYPAAVAAALKFTDYLKIDYSGKKVVIVNNSPLIGLPLSAIYSRLGATVTICHEQTKNLGSHTQSADILITAVGKADLIRGNMVKEGTIVIDIGTSLHPQTGKLVGDVEFSSVSPKASYITPTPGGVGPLTVACLFENLLKLSHNK